MSDDGTFWFGKYEASIPGFKSNLGLFAVDDPEVSLDEDSQDVFGDLDALFGQVGCWLVGNWELIVLHSGAGKSYAPQSGPFCW